MRVLTFRRFYLRQELLGGLEDEVVVGLVINFITSNEVGAITL